MMRLIFSATDIVYVLHKRNISPHDIDGQFIKDGIMVYEKWTYMF